MQSTCCRSSRQTNPSWREGSRYGLPYNCGPYGLAYNTAVVKEAPKSWNVFWDKRYAGKYTINNNFHKVNIWITALALGYKYEDLFNIDRLDRKKIQPKLNELVKGAKTPLGRGSQCG